MQNSNMQVASKKMFGLNGLFSKLGKSKKVNASGGFAAFFNSLVSNLKSVDSEKQTVSSTFFEKLGVKTLKDNSKAEEMSLPNFPFLSENLTTAGFNEMSLHNDNSSSLNFLNSINPADLNESQPKVLTNKKAIDNNPDLKLKTLSTFKSFLNEMKSISAEKSGNNRMIAKLLQEPVEVQKTVYAILKEIAQLSETQFESVKITAPKVLQEKSNKTHQNPININIKPDGNSLMQNIENVSKNTGEASNINIEAKSKQGNILIEVNKSEVTITAQKSLKKTLNKASAYLKNFVRHDFTLAGKTVLNKIESGEKKVSPSVVSGLSKSKPGVQKNAPAEKLSVKNIAATDQKNLGKTTENINNKNVKNGSKAKSISGNIESKLTNSSAVGKNELNKTGAETDKKNVKSNTESIKAKNNLAAKKHNSGILDNSVPKTKVDEKSPLIKTTAGTSKTLRKESTENIVSKNNLSKEKNRIDAKSVKTDVLDNNHSIKNKDGISKILENNSSDKIIGKNNLPKDNSSFGKLNTNPLKQETIERGTNKNALNTVSRHSAIKKSEIEPNTISEKAVPIKIKAKRVEVLRAKPEINKVKNVQGNIRTINVTKQHKPDSVQDHIIESNVKKVFIPQEIKESFASSLKSFSAEKEKPLLEMDKSTPEKTPIIQNKERVVKEESIDYNVNKNLKIKFVFTNEIVNGIPKTTAKQPVQNKVKRTSMQDFQNKTITLNDVLKQGVQSSKIQNQVELNPARVTADQQNFISEMAALKIKETANRKNQNNPKTLEKVSNEKIDEPTEKTVFKSHGNVKNNVAKSAVKINDNFNFFNEQSTYKINISQLDESELIDFNKQKTTGAEETTSSIKNEELVLNSNNQTSKIITGISPKMVTPVKYLSEVIQKFYDSGSQTFTQSQVVVDGGEMGKLDIRLNKNATTQSILILVENDTIKTEMARILPHLAESLQSKGVQLNSVNIDVGQAWDKNNKRQNGRNNPKTKFTQAMEGTNDQDTTVNSKRYYGYNTMDIIA